jgi:glycosidase
MNDFIFGTLAAKEQRHERVLSARRDLTHRHWREPLDPKPGQSILIKLNAGPDQRGERAWIYWSTDGHDPVGKVGLAEHGFSAPLRVKNIEWDTELWGYTKTFVGVIPPQEAGTVVRYRLSLEMFDGQELFADDGVYFAFYVADDPPPAWTEDAVIYHIFVDRFFPGKDKQWKDAKSLLDFYGGTLKGIEEKLGYISDFGFNTLWLSPIFPSPSHHGYDSTSLFDIEPRLGTLDDFKSLIKAAHSMGIRIILDFVPNHWSNLHSTFQDAQTNPESPFRDWYTFKSWPEDYETFFGVKNLPQLNLRNPGARQHLLDATKFWLGLGVDGFRLDYAIGPAHDFWADFRKSCWETNPDCWTFGEIVDPSDIQLSFRGGLDGSLDFMLLEAIRQTIAFDIWPVERFGSFLQRHFEYFPEDFTLISFLDNHDMNRFLWAVEGDIQRLKLAALCQFALPGAPIVYYGTEVGLSQERDIRQDGLGLLEEARLPMKWDDSQNEEVRDFYRRLIALRTGDQCLKSGKYETQQASDGVLIFTRLHKTETVTIILNLSVESSKTIQLHGQWKNYLATDSSVFVNEQDGHSLIELPSLSGIILKKK